MGLWCLLKQTTAFSAAMSAHFQSLWPHADNTLKELAFMFAETGVDAGVTVNVKEQSNSQRMALPLHSQ